MVDEDVAFLPKPFTRVELTLKVQKVLDAPAPPSPAELRVTLTGLIELQ